MEYIERTLNGRYQLKKLIGSGGMANVFEAEDLAEKAAAYFLHTGYDDFLKLGVAVVDIGQVQPRTTLVIDEAARRYGFDVRIRYTRQDTRRISTVETVQIVKKE